MSRSFAGGIIREIEIMSERLVPLMDEIPAAWEHAIFADASKLRETLLRFEAAQIEAATTQKAA